jgi:urease accessory protein
MLADLTAGSAAENWRARLDLQFGVGPGGTALTSKAHTGPLCVQKPFHPGNGSCHVYVLHPPGGLTGGDELELHVGVAAGASALVTMPASTKFYRSRGREARVFNRLDVKTGAKFEWLPPETILFGGSKARLSTEIHLDRAAVFIGWEILALGRTLSGDRFEAGGFEQRLSCYVDGRPLLLERTSAAAGDTVLSASWGYATAPYSATLLAWPAGPDRLALVRDALGDDGRFRHGGTVVDGLLVLRMTGHKLEALRAGLESAWRALAPLLLGRPALAPRIWQT